MKTTEGSKPEAAVVVREQGQSVLHPVVVCLLVALAVILMAYLIAAATDQPLAALTRDPVSVMDGPFYIGFVSTIGVMLWAAAAGAGMLGYLAARPGRFGPFLLAAGTLSLILGLDDALLLHEDFFPNYVGIPEKATLLGYVMLILSFLWFFRKRILASGYLLLLGALLFWGLSVVIDLVVPFADLETFVEDSLKFTGIVFWLGYVFQVSLKSILRRQVG